MQAAAAFSQLWQRSKGQMKIAGTLNLVKGIASLSSRPAFMNAPFRCWAFLLDHNINGVLEIAPKRWDKGFPTAKQSLRPWK